MAKLSKALGGSRGLWNPERGNREFLRALPHIKIRKDEYPVYIVPTGKLIIIRSNSNERAEAAARRFCRTFVNQLRKAIREQRYRHPDLSARYLRWKKQNNYMLSGSKQSFYYASGTFLKNLNYKKQVARRPYMRIGFKSKFHRPPYRKSGYPELDMLAFWLEYGTRKMPPRPLFRRTLNVVMRKMPRQVINVVGREINRRVPINKKQYRKVFTPVETRLKRKSKGLSRRGL